MPIPVEAAAPPPQAADEAMPPLPFLALGLVLGAVGLVGTWPWWAALIPAWGAVALVRWAPRAMPALLVLAGLAAGSALAAPPAPWPAGGGVVRVVGTVVDTWAPRRFDGGQRLLLDHPRAVQPAGWTPPASILITAPAAPDARPGDEIEAAGALLWDGRRPQLTAVEFRRITAREDGPAGWAWRALAGFRERPELAEALLLGRGDPPETQAFRTSGLLHLLAVSGMHLALAAVLGLWLLRACGVGWRSRLVAGALLILGYTWLTGAAPATQRACAMGLALVLYDVLARRPHPLGAVSVAVFALALWDPPMLRSLGFLLSLAAAVAITTLGLDLMALRRRWLPLTPWPLDRLTWRGLLWCSSGALDALAIGTAASLAVAPMIAWCFGTVTPWGAIATMVAAVPCTLALWLGLPLLLLAGAWPDGPWAGLYRGCEWCLEALARCADVAAALPGATLVSGPPPIAVAVCWPLLFWRLRTGRELILRIVALGVLIGAWGTAAS